MYCARGRLAVSGGGSLTVWGRGKYDGMGRG